MSASETYRLVRAAIGIRVSQAQAKTGLTKRQFCTMTGMPEPLLSGVIRGDRPLHDENIYRLNVVLGIDLAWLMLGTGTMFCEGATTGLKRLRDMTDAEMADYVDTRIGATLLMDSQASASMQASVRPPASSI